MSSPVPYSSLVLSAHDAPITSRMWFSAVSDMSGWGEGLDGIQSRSLSLARQCGRFGDGKGWRLGWYGRGLLELGGSVRESWDDGEGGN